MPEITRWAPSWQQVTATIGCGVPLLVGLLLVLASAAGAPPEHAVISRGGQTVAYQVSFQDYSFGHVAGGPIAPTTSVTDARCQAWRQTSSSTCPDPSVLAREFWPAVTEMPGMLYVGTICDTRAEHFNLEFTGSWLILHCHSAAPWITLQPRELGVYAPPSTALVVVPTSELGFEQLSVYEEDRVERWLNDQVNLTELGVVQLGV